MIRQTDWCDGNTMCLLVGAVLLASEAGPTSVMHSVLIRGMMCQWCLTLFLVFSHTTLSPRGALVIAAGVWAACSCNRGRVPHVDLVAALWLRLHVLDVQHGFMGHPLQDGSDVRA